MDLPAGGSNTNLDGQIFSDMPGTEAAVDFLIIGGGVVGLAAAYYLSKGRDASIMLLERGKLFHDAASSSGESRMYRQMYSQEYFARMQAAALPLWRELEAESHSTLLRPHGLLFYGRTDIGETVEGSVPSALVVLQKLGIPHEHFKCGMQLAARWPVKAQPGDQGVFEPGAGAINALEACRALHRLAAERGVVFCEGEAAMELGKMAAGRITVPTNRGRTIRARRVILVAGAWTAGLLRPWTELDLEIWGVHWGHYWVDPALKDQYPQWYYFGREGAGPWDGGLYYGFPTEGEEPCVKVGCDFAPPGSRFRCRRMADFSWQPHAGIAAALDTFLRSAWRGFRARRDLQVSPYTMTRDGFFILDNLPRRPEIAVFTGGCGRAFKFAPLLGRCLADLALDRPPPFDLGPLSIQREALRPPSRL